MSLCIFSALGIDGAFLILIAVALHCVSKGLVSVEFDDTERKVIIGMAAFTTLNMVAILAGQAR